MDNNDVSDFYKAENLRKLQGYNVAVYHAKNSLFISAGLVIITQVIAYARLSVMPGTFDLLLNVFMFCTFIGLALWTQKKPYSALRLGASVYCVYILIYTVPFIYSQGITGVFAGLYSGCLFKIIILSLIAKAAPKAKQMQKLDEETETEQ